jgi:hypothetical protein
MEVRPVVLKNGKLELLQSGDTLTASFNFSFKKIVTGLTLTIPVNQQMSVIDGIEIEGSLDIEGELCLIF